ncbi:MAG TPA: ATP cone domain-containing protein [Candidatus Nanoarchaeia archaeon]|nr:ATP cone domain-containing protein [Candidatus Nanoarchaeia archaeon]
MHCPYCSNEDTKVLESRISEDSLRRRRECLKCENRFTTYEKAVFQFSVIKKDGKEQPFNIEKIRNSVVKAIGKAEEEPVMGITKRIEQKILSRKKNFIKTTDIGKIVLQELKRFDSMAYVRFATIHKDIGDPKMLKRELQLMTA